MTGKRNAAISASEAIRLMRACLRNAQAIKADADLLLERERYLRAAFLYGICLEELGKLPMLFRCLQAGSDKELWRRFWKKFRSHKRKLASRIAEVYIGLTSPEIAAILKSFMYSTDELKQRVLYVDFQNGEILTPDEMPVSEHLAKTLRLVLELELPYHQFVVRGATEDVLTGISMIPAQQPVRGESAAEYVARTAAQGLATLGIDAPPQQAGEDGLSYARRVFGPAFDDIIGKPLEGVDLSWAEDAGPSPSAGEPDN